MALQRKLLETNADGRTHACIQGWMCGQSVFPLLYLWYRQGTKMHDLFEVEEEEVKEEVEEEVEVKQVEEAKEEVKEEVEEVEEEEVEEEWKITGT